MSMMKHCQEVLDSGDITSRYAAAAFVIRTAVYHRDLPLKDRRELYEKMVDEYSRRYSLAKSVLGKTIATGTHEIEGTNSNGL